MPSDEPMYCSQQINIPPELPDVLKQFTKAAIRTQPLDILQWSAAYFNALANDEKPPVKDRLDFQLGEANEKALTREAIAVLHRQLGDRPIVELSKVSSKWNAMCLSKDDLQSVLRAGSFAEDFEWLKFLVLACSHVSKNLVEALTRVCEVVTKDLEGGRAKIDFETFTYLYRYLASIDGEIPSAHVDEVIDYLQYEADNQSGMIAPRNFNNDSCPPLIPKESDN